MQGNANTILNRKFTSLSSTIYLCYAK